MQGFNMGRYRPPADLDTSLSGLPPTKQAHPLGARARKVPYGGGLIVRFEMPFAIWCSTCPSRSNNQLIGQGVRFNAEKKKAGNYFSTPIWSFRMKHTACGGWIEIRTDPKSSDFLVTEGARKRDTGDDAMVASREGGMLLVGTGPGEDREKRKLDALETLEGKKEAKDALRGDAKRIEELRSLRERDWKDMDERNKKLRASFRVGRRARDKDEIVKERLREQMSLGIELLDEDENDKKMASFVEFRQLGESGDDVLAAATHRVNSQPLFAQITNNERFGTRSSTKTNESSGNLANTRMRALHQDLAGNTRAAADPFMITTQKTGLTTEALALPSKKSNKASSSASNFSNVLGLSSRGLHKSEPGNQSILEPAKQLATQMSLVMYDSE